MASAESGNTSGDEDDDHTQNGKDTQEPDEEPTTRLTGNDGKADAKEPKVDLPFVIKSAKEYLHTQPGIVQIGENCVVVTLNFDTSLVSEMLEKGSLNVQLSSGGVLVDVKWPGKERKQANMKIKASIIETVEKVKEQLEKKVIRRLFDENNKYETLRSVIQMLQKVEALVDEIKGGCIEFWIACEDKQRVEREKDSIRLFLAEKLLPGEDVSVVTVSILDVETAIYRSEIPPRPKEDPSQEETRREEKTEAQGKTKPKRLPSVHGKPKKRVEKDGSPQAPRFLWKFYIENVILVICVAALLIGLIQQPKEIQYRQNQVDALETLNLNLENNIIQLQMENQRLEMRLSEMMKTAIKDADGFKQTDADRKYTIASDFKGLYDNEYTRASIELEKLGLFMGTENMAQYLLNILRLSDSLCRRYSTKHLSAIRQSITTLSVEVPIDQERRISSEALQKDEKASKTNTVNLTIDDLELSQIIDVKRTVALKFQGSVVKNLYKVVATELDVVQDRQPKLVSYINKCLQLCWMMYMHEHPIFIDFVQVLNSTLFDADMFKPFLSSGKYIAYIVWPPLYFRYGGNILSKGIAEGRD